MTIMDTEPLDGQDYANGVLGYITLVSGGGKLMRTHQNANDAKFAGRGYDCNP